MKLSNSIAVLGAGLVLVVVCLFVVDGAKIRKSVLPVEDTMPENRKPDEISGDPPSPIDSQSIEELLQNPLPLEVRSGLR